MVLQMVEDLWTECKECLVSVFPPGGEGETGFSEGSTCSAESCTVPMEPYLSHTSTAHIEPKADQVNKVQLYNFLLYSKCSLKYF